MKNKIIVQNIEVSMKDDYISLTDIAKYKDTQEANEIIRNWLRNRNTIEFLGICKIFYNDDFKPVEFDGFRKKAGLNSFTLSTKQWVESTNTIGLISKSGRYGETYAHKDIAFEFAHFIDENITQSKRVEKLNKVAIKQMNILLKDKSMKQLGELK